MSAFCLFFDKVVAVDFSETGNAAYLYGRDTFENQIAPRLRGRVGKVTEILKRKDLLSERLRHAANWGGRDHEIEVRLQPPSRPKLGLDKAEAVSDCGRHRDDFDLAQLLLDIPPVLFTAVWPAGSCPEACSTAFASLIRAPIRDRRPAGSPSGRFQTDPLPHSAPYDGKLFPEMSRQATVHVDIELPADLDRLSLPEGVDRRLHALLDKQDHGQPLT